MTQLADKLQQPKGENMQSDLITPGSFIDVEGNLTNHTFETNRTASDVMLSQQPATQRPYTRQTLGLMPSNSSSTLSPPLVVKAPGQQN